MEILRAVRAVWRRRLALAPGVALALVLGVATAGGHAASMGVALTRVALDTPKSQLVESAPDGAPTLAWRAGVLAHLVATDSMKAAVARRAGIRPDDLAVIDPELAPPPVPSSLPKAASEVAGVDPRPYVVSAYLSNGRLPIISISTTAPDRRGAVRLAAATGEVLKGAALAHAGAGRQAFVVDRVAPVHARTVTTRSGRLRSLMIVLAVLAAWSAGVLLAGRIRRRPASAPPAPALVARMTRHRRIGERAK